MQKNFLLACGLMACALIAQAQKLTFATGFDSLGKPAKSPSYWVIPQGGQLSVGVAHSQSAPMNAYKGYLFIDKRNHLGEYQEYRTKRVKAYPASVFATDTISFIEDGHYAVSYASDSKKVLSTDTLWIHQENEVLFCKSVNASHEPVGITNSIAPTETGLYYYDVFFRSARPFDTHKLRTRITKYENGDYRKVISDSQDTVLPEWTAFYYRGAMFLKPGRYKFEIFRFNGEPFAVNYLYLQEPGK